MAAILQEPVTADVIQAEMDLDPAALLAEPEPEEEEPDTRKTAEEWAAEGFDKGAIIALSALNLVRGDELADEGKIAEKKAPWWIVPETPEHVQKILQMKEIRERRKGDRVKQHGRWLRKENKGLEFIDKIVEPLCVEVTRKHLPLGLDGKPKQQFVEMDEKRLQLRTASETVKLNDPEAVIRQMEAWERELAEIEGRFESVLNPLADEDERRRLVDRLTLLEPDLAQLSEAFRLSITTTETFTGEAITGEFPDLPRAEEALPFRVVVTVREDYLGAAGWAVYGEQPEPAVGEEYVKTVNADNVEAFVKHHPPVVTCDEKGEVIDEHPYELLGVVRVPPHTTIHAG